MKKIEIFLWYSKKYLITFIVCFVVFYGLFARITYASTTTASGSANIMYDYPNLAPNSYQYAKTRLFDGVDMWTQNGGTTSSGGVNCTDTPPTDLTQLKQKLISDYGVNPTGPYFNAQTGQATFSTMCILKQYGKYWGLLGSQAKNIPIDFEGPYNGSCFGHADGASGLILYGQTVCDAVIDKFILIHELGHMLRFRNADLFLKWLTEIYRSGPDAKPRHGYISLPTWDCQLDYGIGPFAEECFPDMLASYLTYKEWRQNISGNPGGPGLTDIFTQYPTEYSDYYNWAHINVFGDPTTSTSGGGVAPNNNTCGGKYNLSIPIAHQNFGDPNCDFTLNGLTQLLQQLDPKYAARWLSPIALGESSYNPNAIQAIDPVDPNGAYGLFQMGKGTNHAQYNRGDVDWRTQVSNAINYNKMLNTVANTCADGVYRNPTTWCYWATAKQWWGQPL